MTCLLWHLIVGCCCCLVVCSSCLCWCSSSVWLVGLWGLLLLTVTGAAGWGVTQFFTAVLQEQFYSTQQEHLNTWVPALMAWIQQLYYLFTEFMTHGLQRHPSRVQPVTYVDEQSDDSTITYRSMSSTRLGKQFFPTHIISKEEAVKSDSSSMLSSDDTDVVAELEQLSRALHGKLVVPWYHHLSPDGQAHLQLQSLLLTTLLSCWRSLQAAGGMRALLLHACALTASHVQLTQSGQHKEVPEGQLTQLEYEDLSALSQLLLLRHLPRELLSCEAVLLLLRDLLTRNVLGSLFQYLSHPGALAALVVDASPAYTTVPGGAGEADTTSSGVDGSQKVADQRQQHEEGVSTVEEHKSSGVIHTRDEALLLLAGKSAIHLRPNSEMQSVKSALSKCLLPTMVHVVRPFLPESNINDGVNVNKKKYDKGRVTFISNKYKSKRWKANPFSREIVDGIKEEDYRRRHMVDLPALEGKRFLSKSRPSSPSHERAECGVDALNSSELYRSKSWSCGLCWSVAQASSGADCGCAWEDDRTRDSVDVGKEEVKYQLAEPKVEFRFDRNKVKSQRRHRKRKLVKMNSFDKNDATTETFFTDIQLNKNLLKIKSASDDVINYQTTVSLDCGVADESALALKGAFIHDQPFQPFDRNEEAYEMKVLKTFTSTAKNDSAKVNFFPNGESGGYLSFVSDSNNDDNKQSPLPLVQQCTVSNSHTELSSLSVVQSVSSHTSSTQPTGAIPCDDDDLFHKDCEKTVNKFHVSGVPAAPDISESGSNVVHYIPASRESSFKLETLYTLPQDKTSVYNNITYNNSIRFSGASVGESGIKSSALHSSRSCHNLASGSTVDAATPALLMRMQASFSADDLLRLSSARADQQDDAADTAGKPDLCFSTASGDAATMEGEDLSPVYEECSNLESSIAKLRSLLSERDSQQSLGSLSSVGSSDSEPRSAHSDPGRLCHDVPGFSFVPGYGRPLQRESVKLAAAAQEGREDDRGDAGKTVTDVLEAYDIPLDGRLIVSCCMPEAHCKTDASGAQYTMYTVQYEAIYLCDEQVTQTEAGGHADGASKGATKADDEVTKTADKPTVNNVHGEQCCHSDANYNDCSVDGEVNKSQVAAADDFQCCEASAATTSKALLVGVTNRSDAAAGGGTHFDVARSKETKMVLHTSTVSRRFREFAVLHRALCTHPLLRHALRGVPDPNRWRCLTTDKLDDNTVNARRLFLETYLRTLLGHVVINSSSIMLEFLAYGLDLSFGFVRKRGSSGSLPRLDKLLGRTVCGVFQSLRATLPIAEGMASAGETSDTAAPALKSRSSLHSFQQPSPSFSLAMSSSLTPCLSSPPCGSDVSAAIPASDVTTVVPSSASTPVSTPPSLPPSPTQTVNQPELSDWTVVDHRHSYELQLAITAEMQPCAMEEAMLGAVHSIETQLAARRRGRVYRPPAGGGHSRTSLHPRRRVSCSAARTETPADATDAGTRPHPGLRAIHSNPSARLAPDQSGGHQLRDSSSSRDGSPLDTSKGLEEIITRGTSEFLKTVTDVFNDASCLSSTSGEPQFSFSREDGSAVSSSERKLNFDSLVKSISRTPSIESRKLPQDITERPAASQTLKSKNLRSSEFSSDLRNNLGLNSTVEFDRHGVCEGSGWPQDVAAPQADFCRSVPRRGDSLYSGLESAYVDAPEPETLQADDIDGTVYDFGRKLNAKLKGKKAAFVENYLLPKQKAIKLVVPTQLNLPSKTVVFDHLRDPRFILTSASNSPDSECSSSGGSNSASCCHSHPLLSASAVDGHRGTAGVRACVRCWGSAVPAVTLPGPPSANLSVIPCFCFSSAAPSPQHPFGDGAVGLSLALFQAFQQRQKAQGIASDAVVTEPMVHMASSVLVPQLDSFLQRKLDEYLSNASIAKHIRAMRLQVDNMDIFAGLADGVDGLANVPKSFIEIERYKNAALCPSAEKLLNKFSITSSVYDKSPVSDISEVTAPSIDTPSGATVINVKPSSSAAHFNDRASDFMKPSLRAEKEHGASNFLEGESAFAFQRGSVSGPDVHENANQFDVSTENEPTNGAKQLASLDAVDQADFYRQESRDKMLRNYAKTTSSDVFLLPTSQSDSASPASGLPVSPHSAGEEDDLRFLRKILIEALPGLPLVRDKGTAVVEQLLHFLGDPLATRALAMRLVHLLVAHLLPHQH